jgi:hypothetical protein
MEANPTTIKDVIELYNDKKDFFQQEFITFGDLLSLVFNVNHFTDTSDYLQNNPDDLEEEFEEE